MTDASDIRMRTRDLWLLISDYWLLMTVASPSTSLSAAPSVFSTGVAYEKRIHSAPYSEKNAPGTTATPCCSARYWPSGSEAFPPLGLSHPPPSMKAEKACPRKG